METIEQARADYYRNLAIELTMQDPSTRRRRYAEARRAAKQRSIRLAAGLILHIAGALALAALAAVAIAHAWPAFVAYQAAEQDRLDREQIGLETAYHEQALDSLLRTRPAGNEL